MSATAVRPFVFPSDVDSSTTEAECEALYELAAGQVCLEFGSWKGRTAIAMAQSARRVHAVDHFRGDIHTGFSYTLVEYLKNLQRYGMEEHIVTHLGRFKDVAGQFKSSSFGLVFCDGVHTREAAELQAEWATRLVQPEGFVCFHDYGLENTNQEAKDAGFAVTEVVDELCKTHEGCEIVEVVDTLAVVKGAKDASDRRQYDEFVRIMREGEPD